MLVKPATFFFFFFLFLNKIIIINFCFCCRVRLIQLLLLRRIHLLGEYAHDSTANRFNSIAIVCTSVPAANPPRSYRYFSLLLHAHSLKDAMFYCEKIYLFVYIYILLSRYGCEAAMWVCELVPNFHFVFLEPCSFFFFFFFASFAFQISRTRKKKHIFQAH